MRQDLQASFRALGDPTRRAILMQLSQEDLTITEVVDKFDMSRTAVRKHLTILEQGNMISVIPRGKERLTKLNPIGIKLTADWFSYFDHYWNDALASLKNTIESNTKNTIKGKKK